MGDRKQFFTGPLARALVLALMVLGCAKHEDGHVLTSTTAPDEDAVGEKQDSLAVLEDPKPLRVSVFSHSFDRECGLLEMRMEFHNRSNKPLFLVTMDFAFLGGPDTGTHILMFEQRGDDWVLDLSYPRRTDEGGLDVFPVIELEPRDNRYITYVFRFPLRLDWTYSDTGFEPPIELPEKKTRVALRFGYGYEKPWDFVDRIKPTKPTPQEYERQMLEVWQTLVYSSPVVIDNSPDSSANIP